MKAPVVERPVGKMVVVMETMVAEMMVAAEMVRPMSRFSRDSDS